MGVDCSSCGCKDQNEFKLNEVKLDDTSSRQNKVYGGAMNTVSETCLSEQPLSAFH